ncbi:hypothetical protein OESDEN_13098 [Oesophagostomum dentatum]|uniref:Uncharacterized protein n=1 Tax=Oesophagostomum dentatum TaxID=61180 RepID=A0A0B1SUH6_OESDE|nr:hypothetical protein OESDEN_13098 [Oesophagostomum dentatum]
MNHNLFVIILMVLLATETLAQFGTGFGYPYGSMGFGSPYGAVGYGGAAINPALLRLGAATTANFLGMAGGIVGSRYWSQG